VPKSGILECLMLVGEHGGDPMLPHIAMMKALQRHEPKASSAPRRKRAKEFKNCPRLHIGSKTRTCLVNRKYSLIDLMRLG
jgi:hypothetical protein